ncbi:type III secretion protein [Pandoraea sputorum]|uniref:type III secretion protein n=1 Tax=Pandoraea sputorum TaxID=93222 RepID=UPI0012429B85|nr:type III secretion protein [Pandoraea sputorum]
MLSQLLEIKRRRERNIHRALAQLDDEEKALCARQEALQVRREAVYRELRTRTEQGGSYEPRELDLLRAALARLDSEGQALARERDSVIAARHELARTRVEQEAALRRNLREQEKLTLIAAEQPEQE